MNTLFLITVCRCIGMSYIWASNCMFEHYKDLILKNTYTGFQIVRT